MFVKIHLLLLHVGCLQFQLGGCTFLASKQGLCKAGARCRLGIAGGAHVVFGISMGSVFARGLAWRWVVRVNRCAAMFPKD